MLHGFCAILEKLITPEHLKLFDGTIAASVASSHVAGTTLGTAEESKSWYVYCYKILCLPVIIKDIALYIIYAYVQVLGACLFTA